jgi:ribosome-binding factor A
MKDLKLKRIASAISREVSIIIANEASDNLLKTITITGCEVNNDLSIAKVYFTSILDMPKENLEKEMKEAASYIRKELASRIEIRHTPMLVFEFDESVEYGNKIEAIIKKIHEEE